MNPPSPQQVFPGPRIGRLARGLLACGVAAALLAALAPRVHAQAGVDDPVRGYLNVVAHSGRTPAQFATDTATAATANTTALQGALDYAYNNFLVAFFPAGTYYVNGTLECAALTIASEGLPLKGRHYVLVGSTAGASRPLVKLATSAPDFDVPGGKKALIRYSQDVNRSSDHDGIFNNVNENFYSLLRGIDVDCGNHAGAVGVQFDAAQDSSVENVKVAATGAFAGFYGLPSRATGAVNIEVQGGQYGIYHIAEGTAPGGLESAAGTVVAGAILVNQTVSAVYSNCFVPMALVGFEIVTGAGGNSAIRIPDGSKTNGSTLSLVDGAITIGNSSVTALLNTLDPQGGRNFHVRNVYVTGTDNLVQSSPNPVVSRTGTWKRIDEYSYCHPTSYDGDTFVSWNLINGIFSQSEVIAVTENAGAPPPDLRSRHTWAALPSVEDGDVYVPTAAELPTDGATDVTAQLQNLIDTHPKLYLPPAAAQPDGARGAYRLGSPGITLRANTILFGAGKILTRLETHPAWLPTSPATVVRTDDSATATTYLGDLSIGVNALNLANAWFTALEWRAGRNSMVHTGRPFYWAKPADGAPDFEKAQPIDLTRVTGGGGGRWYFLGGFEQTRNDHDAFRLLRVTGTTEPLWIYGLNLEHARGETLSEFVNSSNIRIYTLKTEDGGSLDTDFFQEANPLVTLTDAHNFALFGHGALRRAPGPGRGSFQIGTGSSGVLVAGIVPQIVKVGFPDGDTLHDFIDGNFLDYPQSVSLYKRGALDDSVMTHDGVSSGPNVAPSVSITSPTEGAILPLAATTISATASDSDGTVALVEFYANGAFIANDATSPYSVSWTPAVAGSYSLTAKAYDDFAVSTTSTPVNVTVATTPPVTPTEVTFISIGVEDGWVLESTATSEQGGSRFASDTGGAALRTGDNTAARQYKSILSFDSSTLPANAVILGASLELRRRSFSGSMSNIGLLGELRADIRTGHFGDGNSLENVDFEAAATATQVATLNIPTTNGEWAVGVLNPAGRDAINRSGRTQFRVYFANGDNGNTTEDYLGYQSGENADPAFRPVLRVSYALPPLATTQPAAQTATVGNQVSFLVTASGSTPLGYEWRRNGVPITGNPTAQTDTLVLASVTTAAAGNYDCVVLNSIGSATSAVASLTVAKAPASITLGGLSQTYDGTPRVVTATTSPVGLGVALTYDGSATAPTNAGSYAIAATINDGDYTGSASGTLVVAPAPASITLGGLSQTYDGTPRVVTATTSPAGLAVSLTYDGGATAPMNAGSYTINAVVNDSNYLGSASGTLVVAKAPATITLDPLTQIYDGTPRVVSATTAPAGLIVILTYDGSATAPTAPGSYAIDAIVDEANYTGSVSDTLVVTITALVRHAPALSGGLDGSAQVLTGESFTLNGNAWVSGDLLVPGTPGVRLNGHPTYGGTLEGTGDTSPSDYQVTLNGNAVLRHLVRRTDPLILPAVSAPPASTGTRNVSIQSAGQSIGDFATLRNLTLNGNAGDYAIPAGVYGTFDANGTSGFILGESGATTPAVYFLQGLTLNGNARLQIVGPVVLILAKGVSIDGSVTVVGDPEWLTLAVASDGLTLNGNANFIGTIIAPTGTVTINGNATLTGRVVSDRLTINGNGMLEQVSP